MQAEGVVTFSASSVQIFVFSLVLSSLVTLANSIFNFTFKFFKSNAADNGISLILTISKPLGTKF